jgi:hypothetical protein
MNLSKHKLLALIGVTVFALTGCSPTVALEPADLANDPDCAEIIVRLPDELADLPKRTINAQSTAAWGEPVAVILRCGLEKIEVSTLPCVSVGGIDWLVDESAKPNYRFITYATEPATEVIVDSEKVSGVSVLEGLSGSVGVIGPDKFCTGIAE